MSETTTATLPEQSATPTIDVPANDSNVKVDDMVERVAALLKAANTLPDQRDELDKRALDLTARHIAREYQGDAAEIIEVEVREPRYSKGADNPSGSFRYTRERSALLIGLAEANGVAAVYGWESYSYPKPSSKRRGYSVFMWGARADVERVRAIYTLLEGRALKDGYAFDIPGAPAEQTKARRVWFRNFAEALPATFAEVINAKVSGTKAEDALQARRQAALARRAEWVAANEGKDNGFKLASVKS